MWAEDGGLAETFVRSLRLQGAQTLVMGPLNMVRPLQKDVATTKSKNRTARKDRSIE